MTTGMKLKDRLIEEVYKRPAVWDSTNKNHRHKRVVGYLWAEISDEINLEISDVKKKWKNLKDSYRKELKKELSEDKYESQWVHYESLKFLKNELMPGCSTADFDEDGSEIDYETQHIQKDLGTLPEAYYSSEDNDNSSEQKLSEQTPINSRKRKTCIETEEEFLELERKKIRLLKKMGQTTEETEKTEDHYFVMSLVPFMKKLKPIQKLIVRNKIHQILMEELMEESDGTISNPQDEIDIKHEIIGNTATDPLTQGVSC